MSDDKLWHFLDVNRGRYLCPSHGGFCDSSDGFSNICPACKTEQDEAFPNRVDRLLQIVSNLQNRSQRSLAIPSSFLGLLGAAKLFQVIQNDGSQSVGSAFENIPTLLVFVVLSLAVSIGFHTFALRHINVLRGGKFERKSLTDWESHFSQELDELQKFHSWGNRAFLIALTVLILWLVVPPMIDLLCDWSDPK